MDNKNDVINFVNAKDVPANALCGKKAGKTFGIAFLLAAPFFLFNPEIIYMDIMPDIIGYLLILAGIRRLRDICPHIEESYLKFRNMLVVSAVRLLSMFWIFSVNQYERPTLMLLFTFSFGVIEIIWLIPGWNSLLDGFVYLAGTRGGTAPLRKGRKTASYTDSIKRFTAVFIVIKAVLTALPEFSVMSEQLYDDAVMDWYRFIGLFRGAAALVIVVFGVIWLVRVVRYFIALIKDREFMCGLHTKYNTEILPKAGFFVRRGISSAMMMFCAAALLTLDISVDRVNLFPDVICAAFFVMAFVSIRRYYHEWKYGVAASGVYGAVSMAGWIMENNFHLVEWGLFSDNMHYRYEDSQVWINPAAYDAFWEFYPVKIAANVIFLVVIVLVFLAIRHIIYSHCGYIPQNLDKNYRDNRLRDIRRELMTKLIVTAVAAVLLALSGAIANYIATFSHLFIGQIWWLIDCLLSLVLFISFVVLGSAVKDEVDSRYMLE